MIFLPQVRKLSMPAVRDTKWVCWWILMHFCVFFLGTVLHVMPVEGFVGYNCTNVIRKREFALTRIGPCPSTNDTFESPEEREVQLFEIAQTRKVAAVLCDIRKAQAVSIYFYLTFC